MHFSWLASVRGNFISYFSTRTECHQAKSAVKWCSKMMVVKLCEWYKFYSVAASLTGCNVFKYSTCYLQCFKFYTCKITKKQNRNYMYENTFMGV